MQLIDWYKLWAGLQYRYNMDGDYIEKMIPFEREILLNMIEDMVNNDNSKNNISYEGA